MRLLFRKHHTHLTLRRAVDARVRPSRLPLIEMALRLIETLEAKPLQRRSLRVSDPRLDLALAIGVTHTTRQRERAVVREDVAIQGIDGRVVDVGGEHSLLQVVEHRDPRRAAQPAKRRPPPACT